MLDQIYYGNSIEDWGISILIIIGALFVNKLIIILSRKIIKKITGKSTTRLDDIFFKSLEKPILMGIMLLAIWIAASRLHLGQNVRDIITKSYEILVVLNVTWFFARLAASLIEENISDSGNKSQPGRFKIDSKLLPLIKRAVLIVVWLIGIVTALHNVGIKVTTLMGTLGIGGIAFALATQDTIKNIFGGITIFTDNTFRIGDTIKFDSAEGTVVDIGLRSTRIRTYDKRLLTVPNYKLTDALITNISSEPGRRIVMELGLTYNTSLEKMQEAMTILRDMPNRIPGVRDKDLVVSFTNFADSALVVTFIYFIRKSADIFDTRSGVNLEILRSFNQAGLNFAFPSSTLYIENNAGGADKQNIQRGS
ncbi:MAG: mechanosensitive ion channel family protein [Tannerella sp.]|jgi:MscS family membrane protein|nr:mechanosensitive ion channel family protein [Tannerella sp.]